MSGSEKTRVLAPFASASLQLSLVRAPRQSGTSSSSRGSRPDKRGGGYQQLIVCGANDARGENSGSGRREERLLGWGAGESITWRSSMRWVVAGLGGAGGSMFIPPPGAAHGCALLSGDSDGVGGWLRRGGRRSNGPVRVLILMSDTGGGHRASAEALRAGFEQLYGSKYHVDIVDIWTAHTPYPFNQSPKTYSFLVKYPVLWRAAFELTQPRAVHVPVSNATLAFVGRSVSEAYEIYKPDLVVSVHPLMQHIPLRVLRQREKLGLSPRAAFATVVTDLTRCHNTWFNKGVDRCYVATDASKEQALELGLQSDQLRVYGLPIRPAFSRRFPAKRRLRAALGWDAGEPVVLLVGGGEGMGPVEKTVDAVAAEVGAGCQLVVICGRNQRLVDKLRSKVYPEGMRVIVHGFVTNMPDLMFASDVIVTKAGPGTIGEALIAGLPMVLNAFVPCQEEGNIPYVVENQVGVFEPNPLKVGAMLREWLQPPRAALAAMAERALRLAHPRALFDICRDLAALPRPAASRAKQGGGGRAPALVAA